MKYIGDVKELNIQSALSLSKQGIDVFDASNEFFNDICHPYESPDGKDIIINDRRTGIYQNATFCQYGCSYLGMNYSLMVANCKCSSSVLQDVEKNKTENDKSESETNSFKSLTKSFISNLVDFNFEILRCYNLAFNKEILIHNIGFFSLFGMFVLQIIFFIIYLIRKVKPIKIFMMIFNDLYKINKTIKNSTNTKSAPQKKRIKNKRKLLYVNNETTNKKLDNNINKKYIVKNIEDIIFLKGNESKEQSNSDKRIINKKENNLKNILENDNDNLEQNINKQVPMLNINNKDYKKGVNYNINSENDLINSKKKTRELELKNNKITYKRNLSKQKQEKIFKEAYNMDTIPDIIYNKIVIHKFKKNDSEIQDMDYEDAIIYDKRDYFRIFWAFLLESQIILGTFCTENYLDLFIIKLSFFVFTFQISFFLNALFYTDDYISDAYHNDGVLDFISGLPKSIYSFIATFITTNLLKMLSNSKSELIRVIKERKRYNNYMDVINVKLEKLRKKLIIYFVLVFLLEIFFLYYVTAFCAVYRNSQNYWFIGCLESFVMDSLVSLIICIFLSLLRYISIRKKIKCCFIISNIISTFI